MAPAIVLEARAEGQPRATDVIGTDHAIPERRMNRTSSQMYMNRDDKVAWTEVRTSLLSHVNAILEGLRRSGGIWYQHAHERKTNE